MFFTFTVSKCLNEHKFKGIKYVTIRLVNRKQGREEFKGYGWIFGFGEVKRSAR